MVCEKCKDVVESPDQIHTVRECEGCGRPLRVHEKGDHGRGMRIVKGDKVVIPEGWLKFSLDPRKSTGRFSRSGIQWFAKRILIGRLPRRGEGIAGELDNIFEWADSFLRASPLLEGLDLDG